MKAGFGFIAMPQQLNLVTPHAAKRRSGIREPGLFGFSRLAIPAYWLSGPGSHCVWPGRRWMVFLLRQQTTALALHLALKPCFV